VCHDACAPVLDRDCRVVYTFLDGQEVYRSGATA
jgi:hypothetical protein